MSDARLPSEVRLQLVNFLCVFAWADRSVTEPERDHILRTCRRLDLDEGQRELVSEWLEAPPRTDHLSDPATIPEEHRELFLDECARVITADAEVDVDEAESIRTLRQLLFPRTLDDLGADGHGADPASED